MRAPFSNLLQTIKHKNSNQPTLNSAHGQALIPLRSVVGTLSSFSLYTHRVEAKGCKVVIIGIHV